MATFDKITKNNFRPGNKEIWPVYADKYNALLDLLNAVFPSAINGASFDTI